MLKEIDKTEFYEKGKHDRSTPRSRWVRSELDEFAASKMDMAEVVDEEYISPTKYISTCACFTYQIRNHREKYHGITATTSNGHIYLVRES